MTHGTLTALQLRILKLLAGTASPWVLTGGAALGGFYTRHRATRDLDLTPRDRERLGSLPDEAFERLVGIGLQVDREWLERDHQRLRVADGAEVIVVDFVGGWSKASEVPREMLVDGVAIQVESPHELLVRKLMALFDRSEPRDLVDVGALLDAGGDLDRAVKDAGAQFSGLSARNLAATLRSLPIERLAPVVHWNAEETATAMDLRGALVARLVGRDGEDDGL